MAIFLGVINGGENGRQYIRKNPKIEYSETLPKLPGNTTKFWKVQKTNALSFD
jgi:hypothetical protein